MVLSGSKRTSRLASYMNGDFGGWCKKAGLLPQVGRTAANSHAFRHTSQTLIILKGRKYELNYHLHTNHFYFCYIFQHVQQKVFYRLLLKKLRHHVMSH